MKFKTRMINAAVAAALGTVAGAAQAVNLGADGQGQVLIYPYYTMQQKGATAFDTYVSIVNSDSINGKAVKVRFLEGKNSQEVLDFNLYLSPNDMWTAVITRNGAGDAMLRTTDTSCTAPEIPIVASGGGFTTRDVSFVNFAYATDNAKDPTLARAHEGYLEIIQMADLVSGLKNGDGLDTWLASKHVAGVPPNCAAIRTSWLGAGYNNNAGVNIPTGGLSGAGTILNPIEGTDISYDAVPMEHFSATRLHFAPGDFLPTLGNVNPQVSAVLQTSDLVVTDWLTSPGPSLVPITAILMRNQLLNEYAVAAAPVGLGTDWVITMPTKRDHLLAGGAARAPFTSSLTITGACEAVTLTAYNREEATQTSGLQFSPSQSSGNSLCWEVNVVSMGNGSVTSNVLGSLPMGNGIGIRQILPLPFSEGWLRMAFNQTRLAPFLASTRTVINPGDAQFGGVTTFTGLSMTYTGLPVLGFSTVSFVNNSTLANFGGSYLHRYYRNIQP